MKPGDLVRSPAGEIAWEEFSDIESRYRRAGTIQTYATRAKAKLDITSINGFTAREGKPVYLLRVEVLEQGNPRKPVGRKANGA